MIAINKAEAEAIRSRFPNVHIVRTMKHRSNRHRYYCEESKNVVRFLDSFRNGGKTNIMKTPATRGGTKGGGYYTDRKKAR